MNWPTFRQNLSNVFNEDELRTLCFDLHVDYEALSGDNKNAKIRELIALMRRQNRMPEFVSVLNTNRPTINWNGILEAGPPHEPIFNRGRPMWLVVVVVLFAVVAASVLIYNNLQNDKNSDEELAATLATPTVERETAVPASPTPPSPSPTAYATPSPTSRPLPSDTPEPVITPSPVVVPVAEDEYMVLVAQLEPLTANERDVTRFIMDDLAQILEVGIPFSNVRIREFPEVITSNSEALAIAEEVGATIVVWGRYDDEVAEVEIQVGSLSALPGMLFARSVLEQQSNVRTQLSNPHQESVAPRVVSVINVLLVAADISPAQNAAVLAETYAILNGTGKTPAPLVGDSVAVHSHRFADAFFEENMAEAVNEMDAALAVGGVTPLVYFFRGSAWTQLGEFQNAARDVETAIRLGPEGWMNPHELLGFVALFQNNGQLALTHFEEMVQWRPDQWRSFYNRGLAHFLMGNFEQARNDMEQAIDLEPDVNWPYTFAIQVALRQGKLFEAINLGDTLLEKFPDPISGNRVLKASTNNAFVIGPISSAVTNGLLQQWEQVLSDVQEITAVNDQIPDVYWMQGFAYCNLEDYAAAEASYTQAIELDPTFILPYLSRAAVRLQQGDEAGAEADFQAIESSELAAEFSQVIPFVRSGQLNCHNFLTFEPS